MDKEREQNVVVLKEDDSNGEIRIANDVVAMIASIAATEVEGVSTAAGNFTKELMGKAGIKRVPRSEERRVGKECIAVCRSRWSPYH